MKARHIILTVAGLLVILAPLPAQEGIAPNNLPPAVRHTLDEQAKGDPVKKITRQVVDGRTIYLVELERDNAINPRLRIAENGELVAERIDTSRLSLDPNAPTPDTYNPILILGNLPAAVQQTVRDEARGRGIADIDREVSEGRTVYEVEFRAEGLNPRIHVAEDGTLVRAEAQRGRIRDFFLGTQLSDTPTAVHETIRKEAAGRPINDIDIERRTGNVVYEVEIRDPQSGIFQLHVDADGRILKDSRANTPQPQP